MHPLLKKSESLKKMFKLIMSNLLNKIVIIDPNEVRNLFFNRNFYLNSLK